MKHIGIVLFLCFFTNHLFSQEPADALRLSWTIPGGTARQQAIGGAITSLGGDISATFVNPAGLAFFRTGDFTFTPGFRTGKNKSAYLGRTETGNKNAHGILGTTGFVIGSGTTPSRTIKNAAFSIAVNNSASFRNNIVYRGSNTQTSFSQQFLEEIQNNGVRDSSVAFRFPFGTSLAVNTYLIDTVSGGTRGNYSFQSRAKNILPGALLQEQLITNTGGVTELAFGGGVNYNDKLMLGGSLGIPFMRYSREASFTEADATANPNNRFDFATISEELDTKGAGINLKGGLIFKPQELWRLGLAFHSPTVYSLTDKFERTIRADVEGPEGEQVQSSSFLNDGPSEFKYLLITPYRVMGSVSYVLRETQDVSKQRGFLTADVEYVNYKASSFIPDEENGVDEDTREYLNSLNRAIDRAYKGAFNVKAGGELKFTTVMVRLGAAYYGNPYKDINGEQGNKLNLSGGLGYRNKGMFIDLTYVHQLHKDVHFPYRLQNSSYPRADIKSTLGNVLMTVGFKF